MQYRPPKRRCTHNVKRSIYFLASLNHNVDKQIQFKLKTAEKFLAKIPDSTPKNTRQLEKLEENSEAFLFFASGAIEIVKRQINDRFGIFDKNNVFYIHGLRKNLASTGKQGMVKNAIASHFSSPEYTKSKMNTNKSSLWILQTLRNQAMHGKIIHVPGGFLAFTYTTHEGKLPRKFVQKTQNPHSYFAQILARLKKFVTQICKILAKS